MFVPVKCKRSGGWNMNMRTISTFKFIFGLADPYSLLVSWTFCLVDPNSCSVSSQFISGFWLMHQSNFVSWTLNLMNLRSPGKPPKTLSIDLLLLKIYNLCKWTLHHSKIQSWGEKINEFLYVRTKISYLELPIIL